MRKTAKGMVEDTNMNKKSNKGCRSIVFARGVAGENRNAVRDQIEKARRFCRSRGMKVVDSVRLGNLSASDPATEEALESLLARKARKSDYEVLVTSVLSRLTRKGVCHAASILSRFQKAGIRIMTLDCGEVDPAIFETIKYHAPRKTKVLVRPHVKEKATDHQVRVPPHVQRGRSERRDGGHDLDEGTRRTRTRTRERS